MTAEAPSIAVVAATDLGAAHRAEIVDLCGWALHADCSRLFEQLGSSSTHVLARLEERLVGHACWTTRWLAPEGGPPLRTAWIDAVVVAPDRQRRGIGSLVMRRIAELTDDFDLRALGTEELAFYERLGWERWSGPTPGVHHDPLDTLMVLTTTSTPPLDPAGSIAATG